MIASLTASSSPSGGTDDNQNQYTVATSFLWGAGGLLCAFTFAKRSGSLTYSITPSRFQNSGFGLFLAEYSGVATFDFALSSRVQIRASSNCADQLAIVVASSVGGVNLDSSFSTRLQHSGNFESKFADLTFSSSNQTIVSTQFLLSYDGCVMLLFRPTGPCLQERLSSTSLQHTTTPLITSKRVTTVGVSLTTKPSLSAKIHVSKFLVLLCLVTFLQ